MARWTVPAPTAVLEVRMADGACVTLRRHGNPRGPRIVMNHGNGLAADLYYPFWSLLTDRFDIVVHDQRSHGWNPVSDARTHHFPALVSDSQAIATAIDTHFGEKPRIGVYHSVSALAAVLHELQGEPGFSALVLFDLPICPPGGAPEDLEAYLGRIAERTRRRQHRFETREEFAETISGSPVFERLRPGVADLFAQTTLRPAATGGYELCCPVEYEARIYEYGFGWAMQTQMALDEMSIHCPIKAIGSDPTVPYSFLPGMDLHAFTVLNYDFLPDTTHFLMLEEPQACADALIEFLETSGVA